MEYTITKVTEDVRYEDGAVVEYMHVEWRTDKDGPFVERFKKADYSVHAAKSKIQQLASDLRSLRS